MLIAALWYLGFRLGQPQPNVDKTHFVNLVTKQIFASGRIEGNSAEIESYSTLVERIVSVPIQEGQHVRAGQILIKLDDSRNVAEIAHAKANVQLAIARRDRLVNGPLASEIDEAKYRCEAADAEVVHAQTQLGRHRVLAQSRAISPQELDAAEARFSTAVSLRGSAYEHWQTIAARARPDDLARADAELAAAEASMQIALTLLQKTEIVAPQDGTILQINVQAGELASPTAQKPLVVMSDVSVMHARVSVDEYDALNVQIGAVAEIVTESIAGHVFSGKVVRIRPMLENRQFKSQRPDAKLDTRAREVWIEVDEPTGLVVGQPVDALISSQANASPRSNRTASAYRFIK